MALESPRFSGIFDSQTTISTLKKEAALNSRPWNR
jgi:hypothetical protein